MQEGSEIGKKYGSSRESGGLVIFIGGDGSVVVRVVGGEVQHARI
jgi:hypothetical protein